MHRGYAVKLVLGEVPQDPVSQHFCHLAVVVALDGISCCGGAIAGNVLVYRADSVDELRLCRVPRLLTCARDNAYALVCFSKSSPGVHGVVGATNVHDGDRHLGIDKRLRVDELRGSRHDNRIVWPPAPLTRLPRGDVKPRDRLDRDLRATDPVSGLGEGLALPHGLGPDIEVARGRDPATQHIVAELLGHGLMRAHHNVDVALVDRAVCAGTQ
mmetsp:Transcript_12762/g.24939  ORF Transcript_12762/g.24939 Transcript_12762/m.24939 type:complete len:214 (+) Transcript_12762:1673-2314(+)